MPAHPFPSPHARARALAASILLSGAPPDLSLILLPSAPGAFTLAEAQPAPAGADRPLRPLRVDGAGLAGVGVGACAIWAIGTAAPDAAPQAMRIPNAIGFALAGAGAVAVLASLLIPGAPPVAGARAFLMIGPGGGGVAVAARF